ncbi:MAG: metallophosphoesterase [Chitinivibrionales bacterium]|nr:metallophosphoesterase [Chitinivibrionales bacterium]
MKSAQKTLKLLLITMIMISLSVSAAPWRFGIMGDTQWKKDDQKNPHTVAVEIIQQVNQEFIRHKVKMVIAVGDLTDDGSVVALDTRVTYAQELYNAGIGFYPLRGNHEPSANAAAEFLRIFPQTQDGVNNRTPLDAFIAIDTEITHPEEKKGFPFRVGSNFSSPSTSLAGLSYAFTIANATFILLDQFSPADGSPNTIASQQEWMGEILSQRDWNSHAFVFSHKGLLLTNHQDGLFGRTPSEAPAETDLFITTLFENNVRYFICGHDHLHNRSLVSATSASPAVLEQIICASNSYKFYSPAIPTNDVVYNLPAFGRLREKPLSQDLFKIGYYIVTIDGSTVLIDYYGVESGQKNGSIQTAPLLMGNWQKCESFGYDLNDRQFLVAPGASYAHIRDTYDGNTVRILDGINDSTVKDYAGRPFYKQVGVHWTSKNEFRQKTLNFASNLVTVQGMTVAGRGDTTDVYAIGLTYNHSFWRNRFLKLNEAGLVMRQKNGYWVNAVDVNYGGENRFVDGPWKPGYTLGAWGIDSKNHYVWAVVNRQGTFAVSIANRLL